MGGRDTDRVHIRPAFHFGEHGSASGKPKEEHHGLKYQVPLVIGQFEMLRIMAKKIAQHIQHQNHR